MPANRSREAKKEKQEKNDILLELQKLVIHLPCSRDSISFLKQKSQRGNRKKKILITGKNTMFLVK